MDNQLVLCLAEQTADMKGMMWEMMSEVPDRHRLMFWHGLPLERERQSQYMKEVLKEISWW